MKLWIALAGAGLCVAAPCLAQDAPAAGKSAQLSKVVLDTQTNPITARVKGGTLCVFPSHIDLPKEKKTQDQERYEGLFADEMKKQGFAVVSTAGDLFADESKTKGDFLVGAMMAPTSIDVCSSVKGFKGTIDVSVEWQVYDRSAGKVVETATTTGEGTLPTFAQTGFEDMWGLAFTDALHKLGGQGVLGKYLGAPTPPPAAPAG